MKTLLLIIALPVAAAQISLTWTPSTNSGLEGQRLYRVADGITNAVALPPSASSGVFSVPDGVFTYFVTAYAGTNESAPSNVITEGPDNPPKVTIAAPSKLSKAPYTFRVTNITTITIK